VSARAARLEAELAQCKQPQEVTQRLKEVDAEFKSAGINPGTTADLTVATLVVFYLEKLIKSDTGGLSKHGSPGATGTCPTIAHARKCASNGASRGRAPRRSEPESVGNKLLRHPARELSLSSEAEGNRCKGRGGSRDAGQLSLSGRRPCCVSL
jgi:hypothetical protein